MDNYLENFYTKSNQLLLETQNYSNLSHTQAVAYVQSLCEKLIDKINNFAEENKNSKNIKNITFDVSSLDIYANYELWDSNQLKNAIDTLVNARYNLLANKDSLSHWEPLVG